MAVVPSLPLKRANHQPNWENMWASCVTAPPVKTIYNKHVGKCTYSLSNGNICSDLLWEEPKSLNFNIAMNEAIMVCSFVCVVQV